MKKVVVVGNGGRENAIIRALEGSAEVLQTTLTSPQEVRDFAAQHAADLTIVGSETMLVDGIWDLFDAAGLKLFGPDRAAARLEGSKSYAKAFMDKYGVKTARWESHSQAEAARAALERFDLPVVVKATGLAAGKGVIICETRADAEDAIEEILIEKRFGEAGSEVVIEEYLVGKEASILAFANEEAIVPLISAKDHKKIGEGESGPNTGGMGTFAPNPFFTQERAQQFKRDILEPTLRGIKGENLHFAGIIFFGLMLTEKGTYLLEYNMRFGDPETQVVLPLLEQDLLGVIEKCMARDLSAPDVSAKDGVQICLVLASRGYPGSYESGFEITGLDQVGLLEQAGVSDAVSFSDQPTSSGPVNVSGQVSAPSGPGGQAVPYTLDAGVRRDQDGRAFSAGGRVLNVVAWGKDMAQARKTVYAAAEKVQFEGKTYRKDIGQDAL